MLACKYYWYRQQKQLTSDLRTQKFLDSAASTDSPKVSMHQCRKVHRICTITQNLPEIVREDVRLMPLGGGRMHFQSTATQLQSKPLTLSERGHRVLKRP